MRAREGLFLCLFILFCILLSNVRVLGQQSVFSFLYWNASPEVAASGAAGVADRTDAFALYYNPAAMIFVKNISIVLSRITQNVADDNLKKINYFYEFIPANTKNYIVYGAAVLKIPKLGHVGGSIHIKYYSKKYLIDNEYSIVQRSTEDMDYQLKFAYAKAISSNAALGIGLSYIKRSTLLLLFENGKLVKPEGSGLLFDFGVLYFDLFPFLTFGSVNEGRKGISLGLGISNYGSQIRFKDGTDSPPPALLRFGATYSFYQSKMLGVNFNVELNKRILDDPALSYLCFGSKVIFSEMVSVLIGRVINLKNGESSYNTFGFGFKFLWFSVNWARYKQGGGVVPHLGLSFNM
ncbi:MAG: hypothetical protein GXO78_12915 [Calditrichaeota bacterium]|nr:hypothetical protein [Calditrichota bacterium]